jgi:hypothetical protein
VGKLYLPTLVGGKSWARCALPTLRSLRRAVVVLVATFLASCASNHGRFAGLVAPPDGKAVVYIYRIDRHFGARTEVAPNIRINYESIGTLLRGGYLRVEVVPGPVQVAIFSFEKGDQTYWRSVSSTIVSLNLAPNSTHFVEFTLGEVQFSFREGPDPGVFLPLTPAFFFRNCVI